MDMIRSKMAGSRAKHKQLPDYSRRQSVITVGGKVIMKSNVFVYLDKEDAVYSAGDVIKGKVQVVLTSEVKVKELVANVFGIAHVSWDEERTPTKGSATRVPHKNTEVYLDQNVVLLTWDSNIETFMMPENGNILLRRSSHRPSISSHTPSQVPGSHEDVGIYVPAGSHDFPFEFTLPATLPASFDGKYGYVRYGVKAILSRPLKFDIEREKDIEVKGFSNLNEEPELARPLGGLEEFKTGVLCFHSGHVVVEIRLPRRGYVPGETIPFAVEIENQSPKKLLETTMSLTQVVIFRIGSKVKKCFTPLSSLCKGEVLPRQTLKWLNDRLHIPPVPPSSSKNCRVLQIKYHVQLTINHSTWQKDFVAPVTITMGTVGLTRQTMNTYLQMLGIVVTPACTPKSSPRPSVKDLKTGETAKKHPPLKSRRGRQSVPTILQVPQHVESPRRTSHAHVTSQMTRTDSLDGYDNVNMCNNHQNGTTNKRLTTIEEKMTDSSIGSSSTQTYPVEVHVSGGSESSTP